MIVVDKDQVWCTDIDDTLLLWNVSIDKDIKYVEFIEPLLNERMRVAVNVNNLRLMKEKKARGCAIVLWSQGGPIYVEAVAKALGITHIVDIAMGKPIGVIDDLPCTAWMPESVNIHHDKNYKKSKV
jgi:phosphoserine phosphatase